MIQIWNLHEGDTQPWLGRGYYVGRPMPLGNPFRIGHDGDRAFCIAKFREWLREVARAGLAGAFAPMPAECVERWAHGDVQSPKSKVERQEAAWRQLVALIAISRRGDLNLLCYCAPLPCHAEVIREAIERMKV